MVTRNNKIGIIKFDDLPIRVILNENESVIWVCLNDVMKVLDRTGMIENGQVLKICRTSIRIPFKEGGRNRWGVKPYDLYNLLRIIAPENGLVAKKCAKMEDWINSLPVHMENDVRITMPSPTKEPVIFNYRDQFPITFKADNGKTFVNATQMARSFNKLPSEWLRLASTIEFREAMVKRGDSESLESQVMTTRGHTGATWIEESLAMELARWLSPDFSVWCNSRIQELVTKGYVAVQQRSEYKSSFNEAVGNFPVPKNFDEALMLAAEQARKIREDEHKVAFYDDYVENRDYFKSSRIADELEISTVQLHRFLAENGIIKYESRRWVVHTPYSPLQCDVPYMWENAAGKTYPFGSVKRWTKAGREYIIELWLSKHPELMR